MSGAQLAAARRLCSASQPLYRHLFVPLSQQPGGEPYLPTPIQNPVKLGVMAVTWNLMGCAILTAV